MSSLLATTYDSLFSGSLADATLRSVAATASKRSPSSSKSTCGGGGSSSSSSSRISSSSRAVSPGRVGRGWIHQPREVMELPVTRVSFSWGRL